MRRQRLAGRCLVVALLTLAAPIAAAGQRPLQPAVRTQLTHDLPHLRAWLDAADRHLPGLDDAAAVLVGSWTIGQLETVYFDFTVLVQLVVKPDAKPKFPAFVRSMTPAELTDLRQLAAGLAPNLDPSDPRAAEAARRTINRLVKRAALLHTDIAVVIGGDSTADRTAAAASPVLLRPRLTVRIVDARQVGMDYYGCHWDIARLLLDQVRPSPVADILVRDWYRAVASVFANRSLLAESHVHLEHAESLFPADAEIARAAGVLHEAEASPGIQRFVESTPPDSHMRTSVGSRRSNLRQAQSSYRKAAALDPDSAEAHLRLGRVSGLLGGHDEAARELRRAGEVAREPRARYFASLFLGVEEDALGRPAPARAAFERAAALFPRAQSPYLALSQLARRHGERIDARRFIDEVWSRSNEDRVRADPWATYLTGIVTEPDVLLAEVRTALYLASVER
jgi:tetratricopeptide (TPR) repeat protein